MRNEECRDWDEPVRLFLRGAARALARHSSFVILLSSFFILLFCGCSTTSVFRTDKAHPSLEMEGNQVRCNGELVSPYEVPEILEKHGISRKTIIHIRVNQLEHMKEAQLFRHVLARGGYNRTALVTKEHAEAWSHESNRTSGTPPAKPSRPRVRYRSANED